MIENSNHNDTRLSQRHKYVQLSEDFLCTKPMFQCVWGLRPQLQGQFFSFAIIAFYFIATGMYSYCNPVQLTKSFSS